jgi:hypothetical protein
VVLGLGLIAGFLYLLRPDVQQALRRGAVERGGISFLELNPAVVRAAEEQGLAARVYNHLSVQRKIYRDEQADAASPGLRIIYYSFSFASQLPNGGMQGIFAGLGIDYATKASQAFRDAGLADIASIIDVMLKRYQANETLIEPKLDHTIIQQQLSRFIKQNPELFY